MPLGHEKLDVYRLAISYVAWVFEHSEKLNGVHRHARDEWLRASQSIPLKLRTSQAGPPSLHVRARHARRSVATLSIWRVCGKRSNGWISKIS